MIPEENAPDIEQLVAMAIGALSSDGSGESDGYWKIVRKLQQADPARVWARVVPFAGADPRHRRLVPDVLRFLGEKARPRRERTVALLVEMLAEPQEPQVLAAIALAFVDLAHPAAVECLAPLTRHEAPAVRLAAVHGLIAVAPSAIDQLIRLSEDEDVEVRNWATFALAARLGRPGEPDFIDSEAVRETLVRRLSDPEEIVRAEAALGLARRGDPRALPVVSSELERVPEWDHFAEAAELLADPVLLPALERIRAMDPPPFDVEAAIVACRRGAR